MRYVAPDTNLLLHFTLFAEIDVTADLPVAAPAKWLFVGAVMRELDEKKHHPDNYLNRRARQVSRLLDDPAVQADVKEYVPVGHVDMAAYGLDPAVADDRIIAELLRFREAHPDDEVVVVSDDRYLRRVAHAHGLTVVPAPAAMRRDDREQPLERENRQLRDRVTRLESAAPQLRILASNGQPEMTCELGQAVTQGMFDEAIGDLRPPHTRVSTSTLVRVGMLPTENFEQKWDAYTQRLRDYLAALWLRDERTLELRPLLENAGDVAAEDVRVTLRLRVAADVRESPLEKPKRPLPPPQFRSGWSSMAVAATVGASLSIPPINPAAMLRNAGQRPTRTGPAIDTRGDTTVITYWEQTVRQQQTVRLRPFFIVFRDEPPAAVPIEYEVRAHNGVGVADGRVLIRCQVVERDVTTALLFEDEAE